MYVCMYVWCCSVKMYLYITHLHTYNVSYMYACVCVCYVGVCSSASSLSLVCALQHCVLCSLYICMYVCVCVYQPRYQFHWVPERRTRLVGYTAQATPTLSVISHSLVPIPTHNNTTTV